MSLNLTGSKILTWQGINLSRYPRLSRTSTTKVTFFETHLKALVNLISSPDPFMSLASFPVCCGLMTTSRQPVVNVNRSYDPFFKWHDRQYFCWRQKDEFTRKKMSVLGCILLGPFQNENTRKRGKMRSFGWHSNSGMNGIVFWSFCPRRWNKRNHSENGLFGRTE